MRKVLATVILLGVVSGMSWAQRTSTNTITAFTKGVGTYSFDVYAMSTGATAIKVGTSSLYFDFNASALGSPTLTNVNSGYSGSGPTSDYDPMTVGIFGGKIGITITFTGNVGTGTTLSSSGPMGERICTVNLVITDPQMTSGISWDDLNTGITNAVPAAAVASTNVGSDNSPLPITLSSFKALAQSSSSAIRLDWSTASEIDNYGFDVQRSADKSNGFATLAGSFQAGHGTTLEAHTYSYVDNSAAPSQPWYRLKQSDLNGTVHYSEPINASVTTGIDQQVAPKVFALFQNYPNPFNPTTMIRFTVENSGPATLVVYNMLGQKVATLFNDVATAGRYQSVRFNATNLASGMYIYRLQSGSKVDVRKLVLTK